MTTRIPATVITGFLGAGKTSMIRHLLANANGRRLALVINEFGDVGIDAEIVKGLRRRGLRGRRCARARQRLHLLHRVGRLPARNRDASRPGDPARSHRHRNLGTRASQTARQGVRVAERADPCDGGRSRRGRGCARVCIGPVRVGPRSGAVAARVRRCARSRESTRGTARGAARVRGPRRAQQGGPRRRADDEPSR